jgi:hypothetical protein
MDLFRACAPRYTLNQLNVHKLDADSVQYGLSRFP